MQTTAKANSIITTKATDEDMIEVIVSVPRCLIFTVLDNGDVTLDLSKVSAENNGRALVHGWNQRIPDAAAIGVTDSDGVVIPKAERTRIKKERMNDLCVHYESGTPEWSRRGDGTGGAKSPTVEAFAKVQGLSYEDADAAVTRRAEVLGITRKAQLTKLAKLPAIAKAALDIRQAKLAAQTPAVDADEELKAMMEAADTNE